MAKCPQYAKPAGLGSIAEQTVQTGADVVLGGGRKTQHSSRFRKFYLLRLVLGTVLGVFSKRFYSLKTD